MKASIVMTAMLAALPAIACLASAEPANAQHWRSEYWRPDVSPRLAQDAPPYRRRYDSGPPPFDPRYAPAPGPYQGPYYEAPQGMPEEAWPDDEDDDEGPIIEAPYDDDDEDDDARIRPLPPRDSVHVPGGGQRAPARSAAVTPAKVAPQTPLPRPRPQQIVRAETPDARPAQNAAPEQPATPKPEIRVIEIRKPEKPEPRI